MTRVFFVQSQRAEDFDNYAKAREFAVLWCENNPGSEWLTDDDGEICIDSDPE